MPSAGQRKEPQAEVEAKKIRLSLLAVFLFCIGSQNRHFATGSKSLAGRVFFPCAYGA